MLICCSPAHADVYVGMMFTRACRCVCWYDVHPSMQMLVCCSPEHADVGMMFTRACRCVCWYDVHPSMQMCMLVWCSPEHADVGMMFTRACRCWYAVHPSMQMLVWCSPEHADVGMMFEFMELFKDYLVWLFELRNLEKEWCRGSITCHHNISFVKTGVVVRCPCESFWGFLFNFFRSALFYVMSTFTTPVAFHKVNCIYSTLIMKFSVWKSITWKRITEKVLLT